MDQNCIICGSNEQSEMVTLREKGSTGINDAAKKRGDDLLASTGNRVHDKCRRTYTNPLIIEQSIRKAQSLSSQPTSLPVLRSKQTFSLKDNCLFCGQPVKVNGKKRGFDVYPVRTKDFQFSLLSTCLTRGDDWANEIRGRIESVNDLHAADAVYHQTCSVNFRTFKSVPIVFSPSASEKKKGRPTHNYIQDAFQKLVSYLKENEDLQHKLADLVSYMANYCKADAYSPRYLKQKLVEHFGEDLVISDSCGQDTIITIHKTAKTILRDFYRNAKSVDAENDKSNIISTAARLVKSDIMALALRSDTYPCSDDIKSLEKNLSYVPESLQVFLQTLIRGKDQNMKIASIGQSIMQSTRTQLHVAPLQIGLGVTLHHHFGSKFLIDTLHALGFCSSYTEVQRFEKSASVSHGNDIQGYTDNQFMQFAADNVDHNLRTLDGFGTFHGMGIIVGCTPGSSTTCKPVPIKEVHTSQLVMAGKIDICFYKQPPKSSLKKLLPELNIRDVVDESRNLDMLAKILWPIRSPTPSWSGIMQLCHKGSYPGKSSITYLPMIDMDPGDMTCIHSTLKYVSDQARKYSTTPILTFDQPLYFKAMTIVTHESQNEDLKSIVLRLGAFHTEMSFLGCIGHIMRGSGLHEILETIYASNTVGHILTGKAVSRAFRAHNLVDTALHALLATKIFGIAMPDTEHENVQNPETPTSEPFGSSEILDLRENTNLVDAVCLYDKLFKGETSVEDICNSDVTHQLIQKLDERKSQLRSYKTAALWLQYSDMIDLLRSFIKAERTGNWTLHIETVKAMLPYFAAAGHNLYAKSAYIYITDMIDLEIKHPEVHSKFMEGFHVFRRSDRFWAGLSSDLVIEQTLMRSIKTSGGLTRGRGMTEAQRSQWLLSMPACASMNDAIQTLTAVGFESNDCHKETTVSRQVRDKQDIVKVISYLSDRDPFTESCSLRNLDTGVHADENVNAHSAKECGMKIIKSMANQNVYEFKFKRANQVSTMSHKNEITVDNNRVDVDPQLLFQRLTAVATRDSKDISEVFTHELSTHPSSLFDSSGFPRTPSKHQLADMIWSLGDCGVAVQNEDDDQEILHILDGGSFIQRIPWLKGMSFGDICSKYIDYINRRYQNPIIVFDGYPNGPSTKDMAHLQRSKGILSPNVTVTSEMIFKTKKDVFLANSRNKQQFILLLAQRLAENGCSVIHAEEDADTLIASTAVTHASSKPVVVLGEDTDILVLLCYHFTPDCFDIQFKSEISTHDKQWDIKKTQTVLGERVCRFLPVIHAISGCDLTSKLYHVGKGVAFKRLSRDDSLFAELDEFLKGNNSAETIISSGEKILSSLYGGVPHEGLDLLRLRLYTTKTMTGNKCVQVQTLPPTSDAAALHSKRCYFQVQMWIRKDHVSMDPLDWGWIEKDGKYLPHQNKLPPAPESLLCIVHCKCKSSCDTMRCSCRKNGLECTIGCRVCRGFTCTNSNRHQTDQDQD